MNLEEDASEQALTEYESPGQGLLAM